MRIGDCDRCGTEFVDRSPSQQRRFCSARCRRDNYEKNPANHVRCEVCGGATGNTPRPAAATRCAGCRRKSDRGRRDARGALIECMWADGWTWKQIAQEFGWSDGHLSVEMDRFRKLGFDLPLRYAGYDPAVVEETVRLYRSGLSLAQVGAQLGMSAFGVSYRLERAGEPRRQRREAQRLRRAA